MRNQGLPRGYVGTPRKIRRSKAKGLTVMLVRSHNHLVFSLYTRQTKRFKEDNKHFKKCGIPEIPKVGDEFQKIGRIYLN